MKELTKQDKKLIKAIDLLLRDIRKNAILKEHRDAEFNWNCPECQFRLLEGGLEMYKDLLEF